MSERNLPDGYESLGTIWNPEVAPRSMAVMDKSSRGEKLNVELVSPQPLPETNSSVRTAFDKCSSRTRVHTGETKIFFFPPAEQMRTVALYSLFTRFGRSAVYVRRDGLGMKFSAYKLRVGFCLLLGRILVSP